MTPNWITPKAALDRAFWMVKLPSMVVMIGPWVAFYVLSRQGVVPDKGADGMKWFVPMFIGGFVAGWLVWSVQTPRWRRWAYERVEDIEALKAMAVSSQYIWPDGPIFGRTEIVSDRLRNELRALEQASAERLAAAEQRISGLGD
jgi:hypothetical protein